MTPVTAKCQRKILVGHFLDRLFDVELVSSQTEARVAIAQILAVLTIPGFVICALMITKYADFAGGSGSLAYLAMLNDECRFLFYAMVVMGFVTVVEWDTLFPDRKDFQLLSPLPLDARTLFAAKVQSLFLFLLLFTAFVNLLPAILFPLISGKGSLAFLGRFIFSHILSVFAASAFVFLSLITVQGLLMSVLKPRAFMKVSRLVQLVILILLLTFFFVMPLVQFDRLREDALLLRIFPPAWFLGLYETLLRGSTPEFSGLTGQALLAMGLAGIGFAVLYPVTYKRLVRSVLEQGRSGTYQKARWREALSSVAQNFAFRSPCERAVFCFVKQTLFHSEKHRLILGAYFGVGMAFVAMGMITVFARHGFGVAHQLRGELLSIPLVMTFFTLVGMRVVFAIPAQLGANWIFRLTEREDKLSYLAGVHRVMLFGGVMPIVAGFTPFSVWAWGWRAAGMHTVYVLTVSSLLIEILLFRLGKIPFTCTYLPGKANLRLMLLPYMIAFTAYAYTLTAVELRLMRRPALFTSFILAAILLLTLVVLHRHRRLRDRKRFVYELNPVQVAEPLTLG